MRVIKVLSLVVFAACSMLAQNPLKPFGWRSHLSYQRAWTIAEYNNRIYCTSTIPDPGNNPYYKQTSQGLYYFDKGDNSYGKLSKVEGLSDVDPLVIKTNPYNNTFFIAYENTNIDIINGETIINVSDIKRKQITGVKKINSVTFNNKYAMVSTSLGIIVIDTDNGEVKDSYIIGPNGAYLNVYECALSGTQIFAATSAGVYFASINSPNLSNFMEWTKVSTLPSGPFNSIVNFKGKIITNYSKYIESNYATVIQDSLYTFDGTNWSNYPYKAHDSYSYTIKRIVADDASNRIAFIDRSNIDIKNDQGTTISRMWAYNSTLPYRANDLVFDTDLNTAWVADEITGLIKYKADLSSSYALSYSVYKPNSPATFMVNDIKLMDDKVVVAPVFLSDYPSSSYFQPGIYVYENDTWKENRRVTNGPFFDINCVAVDPNDFNHKYAGSYGGGVLEYVGDSVVAYFNNTNSILPLANLSSGTDVRVTDMATDKDGTLWVNVAYSDKCLNARDVNGTWHNIDFGSGTIITDQMIVDQNKQVWFITLAPAIGVYKHDGSFSQPNSSNTFTLNTADEDGKISGSVIYCLAEDNEGDIWIGTNKGVFVIYDPENVIPSQSYTAQKILIEEDGVTKVLFETEDVSCIAVDGANNKWIGTRKNGVFCVSPDGQKELYHFTMENSALFSNNIIEIAVNQKNGEVFFGTDKGLISFQNTVIEGFEKYSDVYAYPNPVKPNYSGPVMIKGLMNGSSLKIIDTGGNIVYEATVEGGQAVWNAKNFKGERVSSGVYLAVMATNNGSQKAVCKIMVLN